MRSSIVSRDTPSAASFALRDRALDHRGSEAELDESLDIGADRTREPPDLGVEARFENERDRARRRPTRAETPPRSDRPRGGECSRDRELVLGREHDADRLLAVPECRVVEADGDVRLRLERFRVEVAGPDLAAIQRHPRTISSAERYSPRDLRPGARRSRARELRTLRLERLRALVPYVKERVPLYGDDSQTVEPDDIRELEDLGPASVHAQGRPARDIPARDARDTARRPRTSLHPRARPGSPPWSRHGGKSRSLRPNECTHAGDGRRRARDDAPQRVQLRGCSRAASGSTTAKH